MCRGSISTRMSHVTGHEEVLIWEESTTRAKRQVFERKNQNCNLVSTVMKSVTSIQCGYLKLYCNIDLGAGVLQHYSPRLWLLVKVF